MIVVSDASPLISLSVVGHLHILRDLFGALHIPDAVLSEVQASHGERPGAGEIRSASWIQTESLSEPTLVQALLEDLDRGEAEAIALARELSADLLIMDERRGRKAARRVGLRVVGVVGVLVEAKAARIIPTVGELLDRLLHEAGFRIGLEVQRQALIAAGEAPGPSSPS